MEQLLLHLLGDYVTQSDWMANNKGKRSLVCLCHVVMYSAPFVAIGSLRAVFVIWSTHFLIDRFGLARYVVWLKNFIGPRHCNPKWDDCTKTGYPNYRPEWITVWLMIVTDNFLHLAINWAALRWL